jgi:hypothetical protein
MAATEPGAPPLYREALAGNVDAAFRRARGGVRVCKAVGSLIQQTVGPEELYAAALVKVRGASLCL